MISLPAALGLGLTADRWMPLLFGAAVRGRSLARLDRAAPRLLTASFDQSASWPAVERTGSSTR